MTCIAVIKDSRNNILLASDRRITDSSDHIQIMDKPKYVLKSNILMASAGDAWVGDFIQEVVDIEKPNPSCPGMIYIHNHLIPRIKRHLQACGMESEGTLFPKSASASTLIIINNQLFSLECDNGELSVIECSFPYAIGSGASYALGSLITTEGSGMSAKNRLTRALQVASKLCASCDDNIDIIKVANE